MKGINLQEQIDGIFNEALLRAEQERKQKKDTYEVWKRYLLALEEVKSILFDYDQQSQCLRQMITKYEKPDHALRKGDGLYLCPSCNRRVQPRYNHCSWCGKMLRERHPGRRCK